MKVTWQELSETFRVFLQNDSGVTAIEYGLLAVLIVLGAIGGLQATGTSLGTMYTVWTNAVIAAL